MALAGFGKQSFYLPGVLTEIICGSPPIGWLWVSFTASLKGFIMSSLTFRSLMHFEVLGVFLYVALGGVVVSSLKRFSSTTYWKKMSVLYILASFVILVHRCMGVSLGFLFCFIDIYFLFCSSTVVL